MIVLKLLANFESLNEPEPVPFAYLFVLIKLTRNRYFHAWLF